MSTVSYPSETFPGYPRVTMDCPDGWSAHPIPQAQLAIRQERPAGEFRPNVVVVMQRLRPEQTFEDVVQQAADKLAASPGYEEVGRTKTTLAGAPAARVEGAWTTEQTGTIAQALRIAVIEHDGVRDLVEVTGTCAGGQATDVWPTIRAIQDSISVDA
ncbi:LpqN/LpqT family lipoprotein [Isoptericola croceus]|uniref:LpqN/LpqT family lipoprotein n=1 Tax=Isoptericola croceus TaxID=3031406 RepID=UPI0023F6D4AA|nr:LpqN/LpqT family lipoprotein [Isoptericola croceus]